MRFTKVRYRNGETTLNWLDEEADASKHKHEVTSTEDPEPEFRSGLGALAPHVAALLGLPKSQSEHLEVAGISLRYGEDDRYGVVVTCIKELEDGDSPWVINTPHRKSRDVDDERPALSEEFEAAIDQVLDMARGFVEGKRAQGELFDAA